MARYAFVSHLQGMGCEECQVLHADFDEAPFHVSSQVFGCADVDALLPSLHFLYEAARQRGGGALPGLLVDGGANVGRATSRWIAAFGDVFGRRAAANKTQAPCIICAGADATAGGGAAGAAEAPPTVFVVSVEPSAGNFALLQRHAAEGGWGIEGFLPINAALGNESLEAMLAFDGGFAIDELATLVFDDSDARARQRVRVMTLDDVVAEAGRKLRWPRATLPGVFLLKLDIEGMEPAVLRSIRGSRSSVKFVTFEYAGNVWRESLASVVADLHGAGYFCFLIMPERLLPVSGPFWDPIYELPMWSNLFCGVEGDPDLASMVQLHAGAVGLWPMLRRTYLQSIAGDDGAPRAFAEARALCVSLGDACGGVTCDCAEEDGACGGWGAAAPGLCTPRRGEGGALRSPEGEVTFLRDPEASELYLRYARAALP